jgi:heat shock protein HslJ
MHSIARSLVCALPLALAFACDKDDEDNGSDSQTPSLEDRAFLSESVIEDEVAKDLVAGTRLQLRFHEAPRVVASAGCNSMDAQYEIDEGTFVVTQGGTTEMGCDPALHDQDNWYFGFLGSSPAISVDGDTLVLESDSTYIEYLDEEVATPDLPLLGPTWTVDTLIEGDAASTTEWADPATLSFDAGGTVTVFTGCNTGTATYVVDGAEITFADLVVTEEGCNDEAATQLESVVMGVLGGAQPVAWEIQVARLWLHGDGLGLGLMGSEG